MTMTLDPMAASICVRGSGLIESVNRDSAVACASPSPEVIDVVNYRLSSSPVRLKQSCKPQQVEGCCGQRGHRARANALEAERIFVSLVSRIKY